MKGLIAVGKIIKSVASGVSGINGRIYPIEAPNGVSLPYVVYRRQSTQIDTCKDADGCGVSANVEVTLLTDTYERSVMIADSLISALDGYHDIKDIGTVLISLMDSSEDKVGDIYAQYMTYKIVID